MLPSVSYGLFSVNYGLLWGIVAYNYGLLSVNYGLPSVNYGLLWGVVAYNYGLLSVNYGLLWGIVASYFGLLRVPGMDSRAILGLPQIWGPKIDPKYNMVLILGATKMGPLIFGSSHLGLS